MFLFSLCINIKYHIISINGRPINNYLNLTKEEAFNEQRASIKYSQDIKGCSRINKYRKIHR